MRGGMLLIGKPLVSACRDKFRPATICGRSLKGNVDARNLDPANLESWFDVVQWQAVGQTLHL